MSLFDIFHRFRAGRSESRRARAARAKELAGDLAAAVDLFIEAELPDEAARVLLLRADAERSPDRRMAFCANAARTATSDEVKRRALGRKALLAFDLLRGQGGASLKAEMAAIAGELEAAGELERAAEAFALAGDAEAEVRVLTAAGAIDRLEQRLSETELVARSQREREQTLRKIADLERTAERRAALALATAWLASHDDERVADAARAIRARLLRGPVVELEIDGAPGRYALGADVTIGRGDATIVVASRAISRKHLRVRRAESGPVLEDLDTRNGTTLAGARVSGPIPVGEGVRVDLGGEVPCSVRARSDGSVEIEVGGALYLAPLGELAVGPWRATYAVDREDGFVEVRTPEGVGRPFLGELELAATVELAVGDELSATRHGPPLVRARAGTEP